VDVAIIGAGLGGLMTAARLARKGRRVAVLDAHYVAGGCCTMFSRGSGADRYAFDIGLHYIGDCSPEGRIPTLLREAGVEIELAELDPDGFDEFVFPDLRFRVPKGVDAYRDRLVAAFPAEKKGIDRYIRLVEEAGRLGRLNAPKGWRLMLEAAARGRLAAAYRGATLGEFLDSCTKDRRLRAVIAGQNGDYGLPPGRVSALLHAGLVSHYLKGAWYPKGGGQVIADKLCDVIEQAGGTVHLRHPVTRILVDAGKAAGVRYKAPHGEEGEIRAPLVVSNADLKRTLLDLLPREQLPADLEATARGWEMGAAIFLTCLAVRTDLKALGMGATNYWQFDDYDFDSLYEEAATTLPPVRACYITSATLKDPATPGHAPDGVHTVEVMALMPGRSQLWGVAPTDVASPRYRSQAEYTAVKQRVETELVGRLERLFPGSTQNLLHLESATPVTHSRFTWASDGSGYGLAGTPAQFLDRRPGPRGPVPGLYFAGANLRSGHGVSGALSSGAQAVRAIERDAG
jgi:phytoene dehydrogenase-like protein